jgi:hypothetical protein
MYLLMHLLLHLLFHLLLLLLLRLLRLLLLHLFQRCCWLHELHLARKRLRLLSHLHLHLHLHLLLLLLLLMLLLLLLHHLHLLFMRLLLQLLHHLLVPLLVHLLHRLLCLFECLLPLFIVHTATPHTSTRRPRCPLDRTLSPTPVQTSSIPLLSIRTSSTSSWLYSRCATRFRLHPLPYLFGRNCGPLISVGKDAAVSTVTVDCHHLRTQ